MQDVSLKEFLASRGFEGEQAERAFDELCERGLTRPGKERIAEYKAGAVDEALAAAFFLVCSKPGCREKADAARVVLPASSPRRCEVCGGSDNRRAVDEMLGAMSREGRKKLLVVGGSPGTREELRRLCGERCALRFVTEEKRLGRREAKPRLDWSDVTAVWCSTEIDHKITDHFRGSKVVKVRKRGVAALARDVRDYLRRPPS